MVQVYKEFFLTKIDIAELIKCIWTPGESTCISHEIKFKIENTIRGKHCKEYNIRSLDLGLGVSIVYHFQFQSLSF